MRKIRCAVVGLGHISQAAFLPGFKNAKNSVLDALVSDDSKKLKEVAKGYCRVHASSPVRQIVVAAPCSHGSGRGVVAQVSDLRFYANCALDKA